MHGACDLRIGLRRRPVEDMAKYYVAGVTARGGKYCIGGKYEDGVMKVRIRDLGTYTVAVDTVPPVITPVNQAQWGRTGKIIFKAKDKELASIPIGVRLTGSMPCWKAQFHQW